MDNSLALKFMITITMVMGLSGAIIPYFFNGITRLKLTLASAVFYLISILLLGIFYVKNGAISCILLDCGSFSIKFHLEFLGIIFLCLLASLWCVTVVYTHYYFSSDESQESREDERLRPYDQVQGKQTTSAFLSLCIVAASGIALSANMITMFIFYELLTLLTMPLIYRGNLDELGKYLRPLIYPALLLWLPAILCINYLIGSTDFIPSPSIDLKPIYVIPLVLMCIFGISKAAIIPLHTWLPAAMIAPHPVSAMLHSVAVVNGGLFCIFKIMLYIFGLGYLRSIIGEFNWLLIIPGWTILYSSWRAFYAEDLKQVLAYSTIGQLSLSVVGVLLLSKAGLSAAVMHMLSHSASKIVLFFAAGSIYVTSGKKMVCDLKGLYYQMPITTILFCLGSLSLVGAPLFAGYYSKAYLYEAASEEYVAISIITVSTILTCLYLFKVVYLFFGKTSEIKKYSENLGIIIPTTICAIATIGFPLIAYIAEKLLGFL